MPYCDYANSDESTGKCSSVFQSPQSSPPEQGFSQGELANRAGITRQAISSIESNLYLPTTAVALQLASILACRVEDLFSLAHVEEIIEGTFIARFPRAETQSIRVKVSTVGKRTIVRPVADRREQR